MNGDAQDGPVWDRLEELSDDDLAALVESGVFVLEGIGYPAGPSPARMPERAVERELGAELAAEGGDAAAATRIVHEEALSRPIAIMTLREVSQVPELAQEIERVWRERRGMMAVGTGVLLSAALLLLVVKLKRVRVDGKGVDVEFDKVSDDVVKSVFGFLGM